MILNTTQLEMDPQTVYMNYTLLVSVLHSILTDSALSQCNSTRGPGIP